MPGGSRSAPAQSGDTWSRRLSGRLDRHVGVLVLALLAYVPALASSPGRMPADTKLYLYLDPGGLLGRAASTFESAQFAGWVPHQQIAYLWPSGPWFWLFDTLGVADWVAHRLWIGTIVFAAGAGVRWAASALGIGPSGSTVAALVYQLSPFLLAYISRTSLLLLPWAGLGWIVALTIRAATGASRPRAAGDVGWRDRAGAWRDPALIALIVATIGAVNATALALIIPGPLLWLVHATWQQSIGRRQALGIALRVGVLCGAVSLWWIGMLVVQSRHGAPVLSFSETLEDVSRNSTGSEIIRSLGYWLLYQRDPIGPTTTASLPYLISLRSIAVSFAVALIGLLGLTVVSWPHRRYAALLVAVGGIIAVGVHPIGSPSPLMSLLTDDSGSGLALALRSSTRAIPVFLLGIALGAGALISSIPSWTPRGWPASHRRRPELRTLAAVGVGLLAVVNLPSLSGADLVDPAIDRDENPPQSWSDAAQRIDETADGGRVLQLPGAEFGAFRWGYTADQPLAGLGTTPLLTRELLPLGSAAAMDLIYALDDRFQEGTIEVASVAPVSRLLGVSSLLLTNDMAFERYRTARPEVVDALLTGSEGAGLGAVERIGTPTTNTPDVAMTDPASLLDDRIGDPISPLTLVRVDDAVPTIRVKASTVVLSGSADGIVDAAAAGLLDGHELVRYSASLADDELVEAVADAELLIVTDSNRDRAHHWRGSQDVHGHTEPGGPDDDVLVPTSSDQRLALFDTDDPATQTVAVQEGPATAIVSSYGEPSAYRPEDRAVMAIDGDPYTAWTVGDHGDPLGGRIRLRLDEPFDGSRPLVLRQVAPPPGGRIITSIRITIDDDRSITVGLGPDSYVAPGESISDPALDGATSIEIAIDAVSDGDPAVAASRAGVGFAEIDTGLGPTTEYIRVPTDAIDQQTDAAMAVVLTRLRIDSTDPWRSDPEPALRRLFSLGDQRSFDATFTLRLDLGADDARLAGFLDADTPGSGGVAADRRLAGAAQVRGRSAFDGDMTTSWVSPFDDAVGARLGFMSEAALGDIELYQPVGDYSTITTVTISDGVRSFDVAVAPPDPSGRSALTVGEGLAAGPLTLTITGIEPRTTIDRRYGDVMTLPAAISEISGPGLVTTVLDGNRVIVGECVDDLLVLDGEPLALSYETTVADLIAGEPVTATACGGVLELDRGEHRIVSTTAAARPLTVDRIVLTDAPETSASSPTAPRIAATVDRDLSRHRTVTVEPCPDGCWLVLGEGFNQAWSANVSGVDLGEPVLVDGGFNGWWLQPSTEPTVVDMIWTAQGPVTWGLVVGAITAIGLAAVVILTRRRYFTAAVAPTRCRRRSARPDRERLAGATFVVSSALLIGPVWALAALVPTAFVLVVPSRPGWLQRPLELTGLSVAVFVALATSYVERRDRPYPDAGWTVHFDHLNGAALFALLAVMCGSLFASDSDRHPESRHPGSLG